MKAFLDHLLIQFECIAHPAGGWFFRNSTTTKKRKIAPGRNWSNLSPDCYNVRGSSKKNQLLRMTPAP